jgi:hypothetical protein
VDPLVRQPQLGRRLGVGLLVRVAQYVPGHGLRLRAALPQQVTHQQDRVPAGQVPGAQRLVQGRQVPGGGAGIGTPLDAHQRPAHGRTGLLVAARAQRERQALHRELGPVDRQCLLGGLPQGVRGPLALAAVRRDQVLRHLGRRDAVLVQDRGGPQVQQRPVGRLEAVEHRRAGRRMAEEMPLEQPRLLEHAHDLRRGVTPDADQPAHHRGRGVVAQDRQRPRHLRQQRLPAVQAAEHRPPEGAARGGALGGVRGSVLQQGAHQQRVAAAPLVQPRRGLQRHGRLQVPGGQLRHPLLAEQGEFDQVVRAPGELRVGARQRGVPVVPLAEDHHHARRPDPALQVQQHLQRDAVHELEVVHGDHQGAFACQVEQHRADAVHPGHVRLADRDGVQVLFVGDLRGDRHHGGRVLGDLRRQPRAAEQLVQHPHLQGAFGP